MLILLSPAKTMTGTSKIKAPQGTTPRFQQEANEIALHMTQFPIDELSRILKLSPKLAAECYRRYQDFHAEDKQPLQAILAYTGVVFKNISPKDFTEEDFLFSQEHMRFVSGCYGLLRPLDLIKPYRMEFDVKIPELGDGNMYAFWKDRQTNTLIHDVRQGDRILLNLASLDIPTLFPVEGGGAIRPDHHARVQDLEERQSGDDRDLCQDVQGTNEPLSHKEPDF